MKTVRLEINEPIFDKIIGILKVFKEDVKILEDIETQQDLKDYQLLQESKQDLSELKTIDELMKDYNIHN
jgi:succinylarginine dihydrolase